MAPSSISPDRYRDGEGVRGPDLRACRYLTINLLRILKFINPVPKRMWIPKVRTGHDLPFNKTKLFEDSSLSRHSTQKIQRSKAFQRATFNSS